MTNWNAECENMQRAGIRRLCIISGQSDWVAAAADSVRKLMPGDWLTVSDSFGTGVTSVTPAAVKSLLGREFRHAVFDARQGFHAEALACLAGTLVAGSWLLLLLPPRDEWRTRIDQDSVRWADSPEAIAVPCFMGHLETVLAEQGDISYWYQNQPLTIPALTAMADWCCKAPQQQQGILEQLNSMTAGVAVLTAPRGRGKSALAGMLARGADSTVISAPSRASVDILRRFAGDDFRFIAPDALLADPPAGERDWLIVDEAAAIPAPVLQQMISLFPRVLLSTTVQGYEGTGRGFLLKFCAGLPDVCFFRLSEPLRWSASDPLETFIERLFLFEEAEPSQTEGDWSVRSLPRDSWQTEPEKARAVYRLLSGAHYRTTPLDLRRMMDAPGMHFWLAEGTTEVCGALWLLEEGGLSEPLSEAVWAGFRRPPGNLVAQSLAAHGGFPGAAVLRSLRISRVAVDSQARRQGIGLALVRSAVAHAGADIDYLSVSFGFTRELWLFWKACGFRLVRLGTKREASSGCFAAMAVLPMTASARAFTQAAEIRLMQDWHYLSPRWFSALRGEFEPLLLPDSPPAFTDDWQELAGFAWGSRPFESAYPSLMRLCETLRADTAALRLRRLLTEEESIAAAGGRKAWLRLVRQQAAQQLTALDSCRAEEWQLRLAQLRKI